MQRTTTANRDLARRRRGSVICSVPRPREQLWGHRAEATRSPFRRGDSLGRCRGLSKVSNWERRLKCRRFR